jgi:hypothetical protein
VSTAKPICSRKTQKIMDQKTLDLVWNFIEALRQGQQVVAKKVIQISDAVKNSVDKIKKEESDNNAAFDAKVM